MIDLPLANKTTFGFHSQFTDPERSRQTIALAEACGFDAVAVGDHLSFPLPISDPLLQLAQVAALSENLAIHTSVFLLALRHPLAVAKQVATLDRISSGRLIFGIGVGGEFPNEFAAAGVPVRERGSRLDESVEVMRKLWTGEAITHQGRHFQMTNLQMLPTPARADGPPIWCGGRSEAALKRAGTRLDGWVSYVVTPTMYAQGLETIEKHYTLAKRNLDSFGTAHLVYMRLAKSWDSAFEIASQRLSERYAMDFGPATKKYVALGRPEDIAETLHAFHVAGVRHIEIDFIGSEAEKDTQIRWFSEEVRPLLDFR